MSFTDLDWCTKAWHYFIILYQSVDCTSFNSYNFTNSNYFANLCWLWYCYYYLPILQMTNDFAKTVWFVSFVAFTHFETKLGFDNDFHFGKFIFFANFHLFIFIAKPSIINYFSFFDSKRSKWFLSDTISCSFKYSMK